MFNKLSNQRLCFFVFFVFYLIPISAQKKLEYGISFSLNHSNLHFNLNSMDAVPSSEGGLYAPKFNPGVGLRLGYKINERIKFTVNPGVNWLSAQHNNDLEAVNIVRGTYFNIPLLLHFNILKNVSLFGGMTYDRLLNLDLTYFGEDFSGTERATNRNLFSTQAGIAFEVGQLVELGLSYNYGLTGMSRLIFDHTYLNAYENGRLSNRYLQFKIVFRK